MIYFCCCKPLLREWCDQRAQRGDEGKTSLATLPRHQRRPTHLKARADARACATGRDNLFSAPREEGNNPRVLHKTYQSHIHRKKQNWKLENSQSWQIQFFHIFHLVAFGISSACSQAKRARNVEACSILRIYCMKPDIKRFDWCDYSGAGSFLIRAIGALVPRPGAEQT